MNVISSTGKSLEELAKVMKKSPQVIKNVYVSNDKKNEFYTNKQIKDEIDKVEELLKDNGRVLVRPSGTEPLIRIMLEGEDTKIIDNYANKLAKYIKEILN
jgi:phosphoglucosamine mutase